MIHHTYFLHLEVLAYVGLSTNSGEQDTRVEPMDDRVGRFTLALLLVISLSMMDGKHLLVCWETRQREVLHFLIRIVIDDDLGTEGFVDGFEDLEVALGYSTCFFIVNAAKNELYIFLKHGRSFEGFVCAHHFRCGTVVVFFHRGFMPVSGIASGLIGRFGHCRLKRAANRRLLHRCYVEVVLERKAH